MLVLQGQERLSDLGKSARIAHRQVDEQPCKRSKKNEGKSAVAVLKKDDWHENEDLLGVDHLTHDKWVVYFKT